MTPKPWKKISNHLDWSCRIFDIKTNRAVSPRTGETHDFHVLETCDWVNIIPLTPEKEVVLIRQYRHGTEEIALEIPGGIVDPGEAPGAAAVRELMEETGYRADRVASLGWVHPNPAILNNRCHTFVAENVLLEAKPNFDSREDIGVSLCPVSDIPNLIRNNDISHSLVISAFYRYFTEYAPKI